MLIQFTNYSDYLTTINNLSLVRKFNTFFFIVGSTLEILVYADNGNVFNASLNSTPSTFSSDFPNAVQLNAFPTFVS